MFQGTDNNESINPNNPLKGKVADDWIQNIKLMNNNNQSTELIKQNKEYISKHFQKLKMLLSLANWNLLINME